MTTFLQNFKDSSQEFKNVRSLVTAALLIALHTVLAYFVSFQVTPSLRISVSFLANVVTGAMFGPVVGFICGGGWVTLCSLSLNRQDRISGAGQSMQHLRD